jgi:hypothetical protein
MSFFSRTDGGACPVNRPVQGASHGTTPGGPPPRGHRARRALRTRMARDPAHTARDPAPLAEANAASWHATYLLTPLQREPGQIAPKIPCHLPGSGAYLGWSRRACGRGIGPCGPKGPSGGHRNGPCGTRGPIDGPGGPHGPHRTAQRVAGGVCGVHESTLTAGESYYHVICDRTTYRPRSQPFPQGDQRLIRGNGSLPLITGPGRC